jgi:integrase
MGTIVERRRKDGSIAYLAKISITRDGKIAHRENKTFDRRPAANAWIAKRETELSKPGEIERAKTSHVTLADAIDKYVTETIKAIGRTKAQVLEAVKAYPIAGMPCDKIASHHIIELAQQLIEGRQPQTVGNYLSHLSAVFTLAKPAWDYPLDKSAMDDAMVVAKRMGLISKSKRRDRRPTLAELEILMEHFALRRADFAPMHVLTAFAIYSTRRQEEITRIAWSDLDEVNSRILVRDMKNPGEKLGNDVWCDLPPEALAIIQAMPRDGERIFPYGTGAISANFTRACALKGIEDLHFHDLRHEGVSRLFEMGRDIPRVALVSGHRSWSSLQRYAHIRQSGDKYEGWKWLPIVTTPPPPDKPWRARGARSLGKPRSQRQ